MDFKGFYDEIIFDVDRSILKSYTGKQGDTKSRGLYVTVTQKNAVIDDLTGLSMRLFYEKPDKTRGFIDGVVDGNKFRIDYTNQMYAVPGVVKAELRLMGADGEIITAKTFKILVDSSIADGSIVSENERGILDRAFELAEDIIPRLELLDVELLEDVQAEMLGARYSNTKDETYENLGQRLDAAEQDLLNHKAEYTSNRQLDQLKVAKVEKELNDYKATMQQVNINQEPKQKASGHGIVGLPKNAAEGQVSVTAKGLTATNIINNGNFANGTSGWKGTDATINVSNNIMQVVPNGSANIGWLIQNTSYSIFPSRKYFIKAKLRVTNNDCVRMRALIRSTGGSGDSAYMITAPVANQWYSLAIVLDSQATHAGNFRLLFAHEYADAATANGKIMEVQEVMVIDLIAHGLESKTVEELAKMFANYFDGTKSTIGAVRIKSVGKNLFDKSRASKGFLLSPDDGSQRFVDRPAFCSDFIRVNSNEQYYISGLLSKGYSFVAYYDKDKRFIRRTNATQRSQVLISDLQDNEKYIRITVYDIAAAPATWEDINNVLNNLQVEKGSVATAYETYRESNAYVIAKDEEGNILELRSLPNGTKDEINVTDRKLIKRIGEKSNIANGMEIDFADMAEGGTYYAWNEDGETETGIKGDTLGIDATTLIYQLAMPVETPVQVSGTLVSYPSGTVYVEPYVADAGIYTDKMTVLHQDLPIKVLEKLSKIDFMTGLETELDVSDAVIAEDKLSFTHPDLVDGDIVFFTYEYDRESTEGETEIEYYDSRYVIKDSVTGKFYKWYIAVADGVPSIELTEV